MDGHRVVLQRVLDGARDAQAIRECVDALVHLTGGRGPTLVRTAHLSAAGVDPAARCKELGQYVGPAIGTALLVHAAQADTVEGALVALSFMAHLQVRGAQGGGSEVLALVPACVAALGAHASAAGVATWGCAALQHMMQAHPSAKALCLGAGAPSAIVAALRALAHDAGVVEQACSALAALSCNFEAGARACVSAGAAPAIVAACAPHAGSSALARAACMALGSLAWGSQAGMDALVGAGAASVLVAALQRHGSLEAVAQEACQAVERTGRYAAHRAALVDAGAVPCLVGLPHSHPGSEAIKLRAGHALCALGRTEAGDPPSPLCCLCEEWVFPIGVVSWGAAAALAMPTLVISTFVFISMSDSDSYLPCILYTFSFVLVLIGLLFSFALARSSFATGAQQDDNGTASAILFTGGLSFAAGLLTSTLYAPSEHGWYSLVELYIAVPCFALLVCVGAYGVLRGTILWVAGVWHPTKCVPPPPCFADYFLCMLVEGARFLCQLSPNMPLLTHTAHAHTPICFGRVWSTREYDEWRPPPTPTGLPSHSAIISESEGKV